MNPGTRKHEGPEQARKKGLISHAKKGFEKDFDVPPQARCAEDSTRNFSKTILFM